MLELISNFQSFNATELHVIEKLIELAAISNENSILPFLFFLMYVRSIKVHRRVQTAHQLRCFIGFDLALEQFRFSTFRITVPSINTIKNHIHFWKNSKFK